MAYRTSPVNMCQATGEPYVGDAVADLYIREQNLSYLMHAQ